MSINLPLIPSQGTAIPAGISSSFSGGVLVGASTPLQAPAYQMTTGFGTAFSNKTIIFSPSNTTTYTYVTIPTTGTWPPESISGHTKVYFGAGSVDDSQFSLTGSNALINAFPYYNASYTTIGVSTNGHFAFGSAGDTSYTESYSTHYSPSYKRISVFLS